MSLEINYCSSCGHSFEIGAAETEAEAIAVAERHLLTTLKAAFKPERVEYVRRGDGAVVVYMTRHATITYQIKGKTNA